MDTQEQDFYSAEAEQALAETRSAWVRWYDDRIGTTWAVVVGGEVGDALGETNVEAALAILDGYPDDVEETTVGRSGRTWLRAVLVRVLDDEGRPTDAWRVAYDDVVCPLQEYPILDEWAYSDRKYQYDYDGLVLNYGAEAAEVVALALGEYWHGDIDEADHDDVVASVEAWLADGGSTVVDLGGLAHYVEQRKDDLDLPLLTALLGL